MAVNPEEWYELISLEEAGRRLRPEAPLGVRAVQARIARGELDVEVISPHRRLVIWPPRPGKRATIGEPRDPDPGA